MEWSRPVHDASLAMNEVTARLVVERGHLGAVLGAAWSGWITGDGYQYDVLVERDPIELLARVRYDLGPLGVAVDLGPAVVIQRSHVYSRALLAEFDVRAGARLELRSRSGYGIYAAVTAAYSPDPLDASSPYNTAMLPATWLGAGAGLMIQVR
jgi:hypothetical protein